MLFRSIDAIASEFTLLYPRNQYGFYRADDGKLRLATDETDKEKILLGSKGKCPNADLFPKISGLGYNPNQGGSSNPICQACPYLKTCKFTEGWYLNGRRVSLAHGHIACHLESMPRDGYDYSRDIVIFDDFKFNPTKIIETNWPKLIIELFKIRDNLTPEQHQELDTALQALKPLFEDKSRHGLDHQKIIESLPEINLSDDLITAIAAIQTDLTAIFPPATRSDDLDLSELTASEKKQYKGAIKAALANENGKNYQAIQVNLENLPPNALVHLAKEIGRAHV